MIMRISFITWFSLVLVILSSLSISYPDISRAESRTEPTVQIVSPTNNSEGVGLITIQAKIISCNCSNYTSLYVDRTFISNGTIYDTIGQYEYYYHEWNSTLVENGVHEIIIFDKHKICYDVIYINVNNTEVEPELGNTRIISPANNSAVREIVTIRVEVRTCNCSAVTSMYIGDEFISNGTREEMKKHDGLWWEIFSHEWDSTKVKNGEHVLTVYGKHKQYLDRITLNVENEEKGIPNGTILSPKNGSEVKGIVTISMRVISCNCPAASALYVDGVFITNGTMDNLIDGYEYFSHRWNSTTVNNGEHTLKVFGKHDEYIGEVNVLVNNSDAVGDVWYVKILSPGMSSEVKGIVMIRAELVTGNASGNTSLYIDDVLVSYGTLDISVGKYEYYSWEWDSKTVSNGVHMMKVVGETGASYDIINVIVNNTIEHIIPIIRITSPGNNSQLEGTTTIEVEVLANNNYNETLLFIDDVFMAGAMSGSKIARNGSWFDVYTFVWNSRSVQNTDHDIKVATPDLMYAHRISVFVLNKIDESLKITKIISPVHGSTINGTLTISVEVLVICNCSTTTILFIDGKYMSNGTMVDQYYRDDSMYEVYVHEWSTQDHEDGSYSIRVLGKHRQYIDEITVVVDNSPGAEKGTDRTLVIGSLLIIIIIASVILITVFQKRKTNV